MSSNIERNGGRSSLYHKILSCVISDNLNRRLSFGVCRRVSLVTDVSQGLHGGITSFVSACIHETKQSINGARIAYFAESLRGVIRGEKTGRIEGANEMRNGAVISQLTQHKGRPTAHNEIFLAVVYNADESPDRLVAADHAQFHDCCAPALFADIAQFREDGLYLAIGYLVVHLRPPFNCSEFCQCEDRNNQVLSNIGGIKTCLLPTYILPRNGPKSQRSQARASQNHQTERSGEFNRSRSFYRKMPSWSSGGLNQQAPIMDAADAIGKADYFHTVRRHYQRLARAGGQSQQNLQHARSGIVIKVASGFVGED